MLGAAIFEPAAAAGAAHDIVDGRRARQATWRGCQAKQGGAVPPSGLRYWSSSRCAVPMQLAWVSPATRMGSVEDLVIVVRRGEQSGHASR